MKFTFGALLERLAQALSPLATAVSSPARAKALVNV
jgi:hypothetical protein